MQSPPELTDEQVIIYQNIKEGKNVIVNAIAGSGKSTTIISIAKLLASKKFLQITYNSMLRKEFKDKINKSDDITNVCVHTYHSLAVKYFARNAYTDIKLREILHEQKEAIVKIPSYDIIVIDECQDMTSLYFYFMRYFLKKMGDSSPHTHTPPQLLILGDHMQCLYEFKGADARYLTMADEIWKTVTPYEFVKCHLSMSYRITNQMCEFINEVMLGTRRMNACREGPPVVYIRNNLMNIENIVKNHILQIIKYGDLPDDIFVLAPSVKGALSENIKKIENGLVENGIPCYVPTRDCDSIVDEKVIQGKVVFTTFHSVKGRQRKYVFIMNFDNSYFTYFDRKNKNTCVCPNTLYVAATRATNNLYLLEVNKHICDRPLPFLKLPHDEMKLKSYVDFRGLPQKIFWKLEKKEQIDKDLFVEKEKICKLNPTELIQFIPESIMDEILPILKKIVVCEKEPEIEINVPNMVLLEKTGIYEDVSDINGIAIPCIFYDYVYKEYSVTLQSSLNQKPLNILYSYISSFFHNFKEGHYGYLRNIFTDLNPICEKPEDYLYLSNVFLAFQDKLYYKLKQIDKNAYVWLTQEMVDECITRMNYVIRKNHSELTEKEEIELFEYSLVNYQEDRHCTIDKHLHEIIQRHNEKYRFSCRLDLVTTHHLWELKFVKEITTEHLLQFVIYVWLWKCIENERKEPFGFKLFNVRTNQLYKICEDSETIMDDLTRIVSLLIIGKYGERSLINSTEFDKHETK